jgi:hypothetical protein
MGSMAGDPFSTFLDQLRHAPNETARRELFIALAATGFADRSFATELALGAEYRVRFEQSGLVRRGAIDAFYGNLVIEFEADMSRTGAHALDQLRGYVAGAWRDEGSARRPFLAVATDGQRWEVYSPRLSDPERPIDSENITLEPVEVWEPGGVIGDGASLHDLLNRLFFRTELIRPTAENFARDFGVGSPAFLRASQDLGRKMEDLGADPQLEVQRRLWRESLEMVYGSIDPDDELLVKHTYLAVLARLLVWAALERRHLEERELPGVLSGTYFVGRRIANLVEDDFFRWHEIASAIDASPVWVALSHHLAGYDLAAVGEDILKPLYEQLVDPATRRLLGEFYTPDWLASQLTERLLETWDWRHGPPTVIDPACGSGTFLRTTIDHVRGQSAVAGVDLAAEDILSAVMGIDVHPLAVTIARATYLLAIRELLNRLGRPITIPVFLANSLRSEDSDNRPTLFGVGKTALRVADEEFPVPTEFVWDGPRFDGAIDDVMAVARAYGGPNDDLSEVPASLLGRIGTRLADLPESAELLATLGQLAQRIADLIQRREDSVYGFVLRNNYRPAMVRRSFDYVIGNPPWLTVGDIETESYKHLVVGLGTAANIAPRQTGDQSHTELATIFLAQAFTELLRSVPGWEAPRVGMVMPRSLFSARHHRLLRQGVYLPRFRVVELWDLDRVRPLFRVPSCVLLAATAEPAPTARIRGRDYSGVLRTKDVHWEEAARSLAVADCEFELRFLAERSAWVLVGDGDEVAPGPTITRNAYVGAFRQGAILYPQTLLTVASDGPLRRGAGVVAVRTDARARRFAKVLVGVELDRVIDSDNLYTTAVAEHLAPFTLLPPLWVVVLPTIADPSSAQFAPVSSSALRRVGRVETASWLDWAEVQWAAVRKEGDDLALHERLDYLGQFSRQAGRDRFVVLYTSSGSRPVAAVLDTASVDPPFVARDKTYWASFANEDEAHFLTAFLNSGYVADAIGAWMTRGLFGARDVHKRALDVPWPRYDPEDAVHQALVEAGRRIAGQAEVARHAVAGRRTAQARDMIRQALSAEDLARVETLVREISVSVGPPPTHLT